MSNKRIILAGVLLWLIVFTTFVILSFIPAIQQSENWQAVVLIAVAIPAATLAARWYYRKAQGPGLKIALGMMLTAALMDALITVPLIEKPLNGTGHLAFFTSSIFWVIFIEVLVVIYAFWKLKINKKHIISLR